MNFPSSPSVNQTYSLGTKTWKWNGVAWDLQSVGLTSGNIITALGYTPYNATNPSGYITSSTAASTYLALSGGTLTGGLTLPTNGLTIPGQLVVTGGNVGIGTGSPFTTLHSFRSVVGGSPSTTGTADSNVFARLQGSAVAFDVGVLAAGPVWLQPRAASDLSLNYNLLLNPNGGNLGVGTTAPSKKFVVSNAGANGLEFQPDDAVTYGYNRLLSYNRSTLAYTPLVMQASEFRLWTGQIAERFVLDGSGNLGLGVTPSAWGGVFKGLDIAAMGGVGGSNTASFIGSNIYHNGTNWIYKTTATASLFYQNAGQHQWYTAGSGTAGNVISLTQAMTLDASSNLTATGNVTAYSDERLKTDWSSLPADFIERLAQVKNGTYTRIDNGQRQIGVSAQSLQPVAPDGVLEGEHLSVAYGNVALAAAVELAKRVVRLEAQINAMIGD